MLIPLWTNEVPLSVLNIPASNFPMPTFTVPDSTVKYSVLSVCEKSALEPNETVFVDATLKVTAAEAVRGEAKIIEEDPLLNKKSFALCTAPEYV